MKTIALSTASLFILCAGTSLAADRNLFVNTVKNVSEEMDEDSYKALGVPGPFGFIVLPSVDVGESFQSNVFRSPEKTSDFLTTVEPGIDLVSDWSNHRLTFSAEGSLGRYADNSSENFNDYALETTGRLDLVRQTYFTDDIRFAHLHEFRGSPNYLGGDNPPEFDKFTTKIGFVRQPGVFKLALDAGNDHYAYDESDSNPLLSAALSSRDRDEQRYQARLAYELSPGYDAFIRYAFINRKFQDQTPTLTRDSHGNEIVAGTALSLTGKLDGEVYAGYFNQQYDQGNRSINFINYGGTLTWNITPLTSLQAIVYRDVLPTVFGNASDYVETSYGAYAAHSLRDNLLLKANLRYVKDDFVGLTTNNNRVDHIIAGGAGIEYDLTRGVGLHLDYSYLDRNSPIPSQSFDDNIISASLSYAY